MTQARSSGYRYLKDEEIVKWQFERPEEFTQKLAAPRSTLLAALVARGIYINECPECHEQRLIKSHDYICIMCRKII